MNSADIHTSTVKNFLSQPNYVDDIAFASTGRHQIKQVEANLPKKLKDYNMCANNDKTERYEIPRPKCETSQKETCKIRSYGQNKTACPRNKN